MEKRINAKLDKYIHTLKENIRNKGDQLGLLYKSDEMGQLLQYIYDYERLTFVKEDFQKRKRVKNFVPIFDRCCAKRASCEQCTRRKKDGSEYCGTHSKGTPNGFVQMNKCGDCITKKIELVLEEVNGIAYYIDTFYNVYKTEDILSGKENPQIIAKYKKINDFLYFRIILYYYSV
jgi:hypothetical protein